MESEVGFDLGYPNGNPVVGKYRAQQLGSHDIGGGGEINHCCSLTGGIADVPAGRGVVGGFRRRVRVSACGGFSLRLVVGQAAAWLVRW